MIKAVYFRYGDKAPRSFGARLFGIVWILVGLVIISTFTATITTMLTTSSLSDETKLYGTKVGVLHNSEEYRLGVKRNAETKGLHQTHTYFFPPSFIFFFLQNCVFKVTEMIIMSRNEREGALFWHAQRRHSHHIVFLLLNQ